MLSGDRLKFLRYTHNVSQQKMADWCGVSRRYIIMIEQFEEIPTEEVYQAWLNCCYGIGKPLEKKEDNIKRSETQKANARKKKTADK